MRKKQKNILETPKNTIFIRVGLKKKESLTVQPSTDLKGSWIFKLKCNFAVIFGLVI